MRNSGTRLLPLVLVTLLAALTFWLEQATQLGEPHRDGKGRHDPDFIVDSFTVHRYDIGGHLQYLLTAQKMQHYTDDDSTEVSAPVLNYFSNDRRTDVTAPRAWMGPEGKELRLHDGVRIAQGASATEAETIITSEEMLVYPDAETARTSTPVTIVQGASVIKGTALEADNRLRLYKLQGRASASIHRQKGSPP